MATASRERRRVAMVCRELSAELKEAFTTQMTELMQRTALLDSKLDIVFSTLAMFRPIIPIPTAPPSNFVECAQKMQISLDANAQNLQPDCEPSPVKQVRLPEPSVIASGVEKDLFNLSEDERCDNVVQTEPPEAIMSEPELDTAADDCDEVVLSNNVERDYISVNHNSPFDMSDKEKVAPAPESVGGSEEVAMTCGDSSDSSNSSINNNGDSLSHAALFDAYTETSTKKEKDLYITKLRRGDEVTIATDEIMHRVAFHSCISNHLEGPCISVSFGKQLGGGHRAWSLFDQQGDITDVTAWTLPWQTLASMGSADGTHSCECTSASGCF